MLGFGVTGKGILVFLGVRNLCLKWRCSAHAGHHSFQFVLVIGNKGPAADEGSFGGIRGRAAFLLLPHAVLKYDIAFDCSDEVMVARWIWEGCCSLVSMCAALFWAQQRDLAVGGGRQSAS